MGGLGPMNPLPLELGGGETLVERIYRALRANVGVGGSAADDRNTIDGLWRQVRARAIASVAGMGERAVLQAFPNLATDLLPYYERLFLLVNEPGASEVDRRQAAAERYALQIASTLGEVELALQAIDPRFSILVTAADSASTTVQGRAFEDMAGDEPFGGGRHATAFPNYSSDLVCYVLLDIGGGIVPTIAERRSLAAARALLCDVLPADNDISLATHRGFTLDVDRLDLTSFGA